MCSTPEGRAPRTWEQTLRDARALYDFLSGCGGAPERADLILAAGSHDVRVAEHAARLFLAGRAPLLICTGGLGKVTGGLWDTPEGEVFARRCMELGVPESSILVERCATNTGENFTLSRRALDALGVFPKTGIAVCKPYMAKRAWATGTKQWECVTWSVDAPPLGFEQYLDGMQAQQEIELMAGDFQRLKVYAQQGFQAPVPIPEEMWEVYDRLVSDGYDKYVI